MAKPRQMSQALRGAIDNAIEHYGSQGPFTKAGLAEHVYRTVGPDGFTEADRIRARKQYVRNAVERRMLAPIGKADAQALTDSIPEQYWPALFPMKRCICVQYDPGDAGRCEWALSMIASDEDWEANYELKASISSYTQEEAERAKDVVTLLRRRKAQSLADLSR